MDAPARAFSVAHDARRLPALGPPRLSVVIVNYLHWDDTRRLLGQLRRSAAFGHQAEVVVVDNHSPPHPIIPRLRRAAGVSLRRWRANRGFARAVNEGCRLSRGDWLLLLNPDTSVPDGFLDVVLRRAEELARQQPRAGIVGFRLANDDGSRQLSTGRFPTLASTLLGRLWPRPARKYTPPRTEALSRVDWVTGGCLLVRRDCLRELGGLDDDFFLYYEDVDLCRRAQQRGWSVWYDPAATVTHHRPLHLRAVAPHIHLINRHALLTYAGKHWPAWQARLLGWIVRAEARVSGSPLATEVDDLAREFLRGDEAGAKARLRRIVRQQEKERERAAVHPHSVVQPGRPAGGVPGERVPVRAGGQ